MSLKSASSEAPSFYHHDPLGSVVALTSSTGSVQRSYGYEPFGTTRGGAIADPLAPSNPMRFTGAKLDDTGLYHMRARQYDPGTGRFTQRDPAPSALTDPYVAAYVYANNRPTLFTDPTGECIFLKNPDGSCRGHSVLMGKNVLKWVAIGAGFVAILGTGGSAAVVIAGIVSTTSGTLNAFVECADGADSACAKSVVSAALGGASLGIGRAFDSVTGKLLADLVELASIGVAMAPGK